MHSLILQERSYRLEWESNNIGKLVKLTYKNIILFDSPIIEVLTCSHRMKILKLENNLSIYVELMYNIRYPTNDMNAYVSVINENQTLLYKFKENGNTSTSNILLSEFTSAITTY